jgi:hypothetical protein
LRAKIVKLNKNVEETETSKSSVKNVEEKHSRLLEKKMKKIIRVWKKYSKEGIMVIHNQRKMINIHLQEDPPHSSHKEASIRRNGST